MQYSHSKLTINLNNIKNNLNIIKKFSKTNICPVVKANAYGLGDVQIVKFLIKNKSKGFLGCPLPILWLLSYELRSLVVFLLNCS